MSPLQLLPDAELLATTYLRTVPEITTLVGSRVGTTLPAEPQFPYLVVRRYGGLPPVRGHLDQARLQVDAWGRTKQEARYLAATAQAALHAMPQATHSGAVVTGVDDDLGLTWQPDPDTDTPRYLVGLALYVHSA
jgi:hypothetical protein